MSAPAETASSDAITTVTRINTEMLMITDSTLGKPFFISQLFSGIMVMDISRKMLERLDYQVLQARNGAEAGNIAKTYNGDIDLAIMDVCLPDMMGGALYPVITKERPNMKVIVSSGYNLEGPAREILDAGTQGFIQKPYSFSALSEKLNEVLCTS